jgi:hypothetical protein
MLLAAGAANGGCQAVTDPAVAKAEQAVKDELRDPDSAKFSDVDHCGKSDIITGKLNAKNRFGAFDGEVTFYSDGVSVDVYPTPSSEGPFTDTYVQLYANDYKVVAACTAAINATLPPSERTAIINSDADMNASDIDAATNRSVAAADAALNATDEAVARAAGAVEGAAPDTQPNLPNKGDDQTDMNSANATDY